MKVWAGSKETPEKELSYCLRLDRARGGAIT